MIDIPGYEGLYAATKDGRIWSYPKIRRNTKGQFLSPKVNHSGYITVSLRKDGVQKEKTVHRLIGITYMSAPANLMVNHINGDKTDARLVNLEVVTRSENVLHAHRTGLIKPSHGEEHHSHKLTSDQVRYIKSVSRSSSSLAKFFGVNPSAIEKIRKGWTWKHI